MTMTMTGNLHSVDGEEIGPEDFVVVKTYTTGGRSGRKYHRPWHGDGELPACAIRRRHPDGQFSRKKLKLLGGSREQCNYCFGDIDRSPNEEKIPCPKCGEAVNNLPLHLPGCGG